MPADYETKVEVCQVWTTGSEWEYHITKVNLETEEAYADWYFNGVCVYTEQFFGWLYNGGYPRWCTDENSTWRIVKSVVVPTFSKVSARYLRKRVREQLAAQALKPIA